MKKHLRDNLINNVLARDFHHKHDGESVFLICSGFSAEDKVADVAAFRETRDDVKTFGINLTYKFGHPFDYYFCNFEDYFRTEMYHREFKKYADRNALFTSASCREYAKMAGFEPVGFPVPVMGRNGFSFDLWAGIYNNYLASIDVLQIMVAMGFTQIFYVGLDCKFKDGSIVHPYDDFAAQGTEFKQTVVEFERNIRSCEWIQKLFEKDFPAFKIYNVNPDSAVTAFPKITLPEAFDLCQKQS